MALVTPDPVKLGCYSNTSRKVRIIGKIRGLTRKESEYLVQDSWITVKNPEEIGDKCKVVFNTQSTSRKDGYELDYCYKQHDEIDQLYSREIKPLVLELFEGRNASVIALGAKGSGKTYTIQGSQERPGLVVMAISDILVKAKESGKLVSISLYELTQEHVKDVLNPDHLDMQVLEDAHGKIIIKGLSKVPVNSITEFYNMYFRQGPSQNTQKVAVDQSHHHGVMVHISSSDDEVKAKPPNKINFVDLAGYEDIKKSSKEGITPAKSNRKNRSLYAILNVVSALSVNETRVPYRESKLTRILQDSLGGSSHVLLLTCLNPHFCQDSISSINLVSRSCQNTKQVLTDSTNKSQSSTKGNASSFESEKIMSASLSARKQIEHGRFLSTNTTNKSASSLKVKVSSVEGGKKTMATSLSAKKQIGHSRFLSTEKDSRSLKGRTLFERVKKVNSKLGCQSEDTSCHKSKVLPSSDLVVTPFCLEEEKSFSECSSSVEQTEDVNSKAPESQSMLKLDNNTLCGSDSADDPTILTEMDSKSYEVEGAVDVISDAKVQMQFETGVTCENNYIYQKRDGSPLLSERIKEICNELKIICESTPSTIKIPEQHNDNLEPKTPIVEPNSAIYCSPRANFSNISAKLKHSLVHEYLNFLNSANKEELKSLKGIGEKRATYIMEMREESPEPFKSLDDLQDIGLSEKQIKGMMKQVAGGLFEQMI